MPPSSKTSTKPTTTKGGNSTSTAKHKHKPIAKREVPVSENLKRLLRSLCAQIDGRHFKNAIKTCDKILLIDPKDEDAIQAKIFALLETEQYTEALAMLEHLGGLNNLAYEKAYALYRLQHEGDAAAILSHLKENEGPNGEHARGVSHLEAQIKYRQSCYQEAFDLYTQLLDSSSLVSEERVDLETNLNAAQTHLDFETSGYLHALDALPASVINSLEKNPPPVPPGITALANTTTRAPIAALPVEVKPTAKNVRLSRVPKGVVPGVTPPPDPERWIKKSERSNFGHSTGKRRKGAGGGATQGSLTETINNPPSKSSSTKHSGKKRK